MVKARAMDYFTSCSLKPWGKNCYHSHFTDKKAEAKGVKQFLKVIKLVGVQDPSENNSRS